MTERGRNNMATFVLWRRICNERVKVEGGEVRRCARARAQCVMCV